MLKGLKKKQREAGTTKVKLSEPAKQRASYEKNEDFYRTAAKNVLIGPIGATAYNTVKVKTGKRGKAAVAGVLSSAAPGVGAAVGAYPGAAAGMALGGPAGALAGARLGADVGRGLGTAAAFRTQHKAYKDSQKNKKTK